MSDTADESNQKLKIATEQWELCIELAKKLERERDEARHERSSIQCAFEDSQDKIEELERERDEAREIIRMAKAKFCEEGSDGNIASEMFSILNGGK